MILNSRADLEAIKGTAAYDEFIVKLKGSMTRRENQAVYPDNYGMPDYDGPEIEPVWVDVEDLATITRFGFTKEELWP